MSLKPQQNIRKKIRDDRKKRKLFLFHFHYFIFISLLFPFCVCFGYICHLFSLRAQWHSQKATEKRGRRDCCVFIVGNKVRCLSVRLLFYAYVKLNYTTLRMLQRRISVNKLRIFRRLNYQAVENATADLACATRRTESQMIIPLSLVWRGWTRKVCTILTRPSLPVIAINTPATTRAARNVLWQKQNGGKKSF